MSRPHKIHIEENGKSKPRPHELRAAEILADYFDSEIVFLRRLSSKTPDLFVLKTNVRWELKSPEGSGKHTIQTNLRNASKQSENIIIDLSRTKITRAQAISRINDYIRNEHSKIRKLKLITKNAQVIDILDK